MTIVLASVAVAWLGLWFHDVREFPSTYGFAGDSIAVGLVAGGLALFAIRRPGSRTPLVSMLVFGLVMCVGGFLSVLPLPILPYVPAQTPSHYFVHVIYAAAQLPLIALSIGRLRSFSKSTAT